MRAVVGGGLGAGGGGTTIVDGGGAAAIFTSPHGLSNVPDMMPAYYSAGGNTYFWWTGLGSGSGSGATYGFTTSDTNFDQNTVFTPVSASGANALPLLAPSAPGAAGNTNPDSDYVGAGAFWPQSANPNRLNIIAHCENHQLWTNNGATWAQVCLYQQSGIGYGGSVSAATPVITSFAARPSTAPASGFAGCGIPTILIPPLGSPNYNDGYVYCYFWDTGANNTGPTQKICVARSLLSADGAAGSWTKWASGSWSGAGLGGPGDQIAAHFDPSFGSVCQSVSWNVALQKYVMVYFTGNQSTTGGWYYSTSSNLTTWTSPVRIWLLDEGLGTGPYTPSVLMFTPGLPQGTTGSVLYAIFPSYNQGSGGSPPYPPKPFIRRLYVR